MVWLGRVWVVYCGNCDEALVPGAQFCASCGYRVILPDEPEAALYSPGSGPDTAPLRPVPPVTDSGRAAGVVRSGSRGLLVGGILAVVALAVVMGVWSMLGRGASTVSPSAGASATSSSAGSATPPGTSSTAAPKASVTATTVPASATTCSGPTAAAPWATYRGNDATSCAFADSVRESFVQGGSVAGQFKAYSPATKKTYTMTCAGGAVMVCQGGNNAVVYLKKA